MMHISIKVSFFLFTFTLITMDNDLSKEKVFTLFWQTLYKENQRKKDAIARKIIFQNDHIFSGNIPSRFDIEQCAGALYAGVNPNLQKITWTNNTPFGPSLLHYAIELESFALVKLLLQHGADPCWIDRDALCNTGLPIYKVKNLQTAKLMFRYYNHKNEQNKLIQHVQTESNGDATLLKYYLYYFNEIDINQFNGHYKTPLNNLAHITYKNNLENFRTKAPLLIAAGADPYLKKGWGGKNAFEEIDYEFTHLDKIFGPRKKKNLKAHLKKFIIEHIEKRNAAIIAVQEGHIHALLPIIHNFPEMVNATDNNRNSLLHHAIMIKNKNIRNKVTKFLITHGAWLNRKNKKGFTPLTLAIKLLYRKEIITMLFPFVARDEMNLPLCKQLICNGYIELPIKTKSMQSQT